MRRGAVVSLVVLFVVALAACGGSEPPQPPDALDGVEGYWLLPATGGNLLVRVEQRDDAYFVSVDGGPLKRAEIADGRLVLPFEGSGSRNLEFGLDDGRAAVFAYVSHGVNPEPGEPTGFFWRPYAVEPVAAAKYEKMASAKADASMRWELLRLELALREWAKRHGGELPAPAEVAEEAAFGRWMTTESAAFEVPWPVNPYTGEAMAAGGEPGDFSYTPDGDSFTLTGTLRDGSTCSAKEVPGA